MCVWWWWGFRAAGADPAHRHRRHLPLPLRPRPARHDTRPSLPDRDPWPGAALACHTAHDAHRRATGPPFPGGAERRLRSGWRAGWTAAAWCDLAVAGARRVLLRPCQHVRCGGGPSRPWGWGRSARRGECLASTLNKVVGHALACPRLPSPAAPAAARAYGAAARGGARPGALTVLEGGQASAGKSQNTRNRKGRRCCGLDYQAARRRTSESRASRIRIARRPGKLRAATVTPAQTARRSGGLVMTRVEMLSASRC